MTDLLVRLFVKNAKDIHKQEVRTAYGVMASIVGVICNLILFVAKIIIGTMINSISVMADAFNNLSDSASSIIGLVGVKLANRPADKEHPFGHGRYEYLSALAVAFLVLQVGFSCFKSAVTKIIHPETTEFRIVLVVILIMSVILKAWLSHFNKKLGILIKSSVMKATAADALGDVLITLATILSLVIGYVTNLRIDGYIGAAVSLYVLYSGFNIAKDTIEPLLGEAVDRETFQSITQRIMSYDKIMGTHDLIVHSYGPSHTMATVHCEVPNNIDIEEAHEIIDTIERDILREMNIFLVIHMDPIEINDEKVKVVRLEIAKLVKGLEKNATIHDFRMICGEDHTNLIFDLVVPHKYSQKEEERLLDLVIEEVQKMDPAYQCMITIENSYICEDE